MLDCLSSMLYTQQGQPLHKAVQLLGAFSTNEVNSARSPTTEPQRERIELAGTMSGWSFSYDFEFIGHLEGDTLVAAVTISAPGGPVTTTLRMTPDGASGLDLQVCAL